MSDATGILVVDKPEGMTSHDVVARIRRLARTRRVGHAGTLDPMATGVLVIGIGQATRLLGHLSGHDKAYDALIRLGIATTTDDAQGEVVAACDASGVADDAIAIGVAALTGVIMQRPSSVSAIKVDGRRAHARVRAGETVVLEPRQVDVSEFSIDSVERHDGVIDVAARVECSSGTYVRALARDLGESLGIAGHLAALRRTRVGAFSLTAATPLADLREDELPVMTMGAAARMAFDSVEVDDDDARRVSHGVRIPWAGPARGEPTAMLSSRGDLLALAVEDEGQAAYLAVFAG